MFVSEQKHICSLLVNNRLGFVDYRYKQWIELINGKNIETLPNIPSKIHLRTFISED